MSSNTQPRRLTCWSHEAQQPLQLADPSGGRPPYDHVTALRDLQRVFKPGAIRTGPEARVVELAAYCQARIQHGGAPAGPVMLGRTAVQARSVRGGGRAV
ncbi:hypothetical protein GCM10010336_63060 [Streptomyces goshikiensis]|nr:hypothetical protein GCM10010336_63060 [Streptomyces goshikiensis]